MRLYRQENINEILQMKFLREWFKCTFMYPCCQGNTMKMAVPVPKRFFNGYCSNVRFNHIADNNDFCTLMAADVSFYYILYKDLAEIPQIPFQIYIVYSDFLLIYPICKIILINLLSGFSYVFYV